MQLCLSDAVSSWHSDADMVSIYSRLILAVLYAHIVTHKLNEGVQLIWFVLECGNVLQDRHVLDNISEHNFIFINISDNRISLGDNGKIVLKPIKPMQY